MLRKLKESKGFTLIEVVIVLAIAGLIFVIVFLAVGQANRNRRDTQRKADANRIAASIDQYASNNQGTLPTEAEFTSGSSTFNSQYTSKLNLQDPNGGNYSGQAGAAPATCNVPNVYYDINATNTRQYTLTMCLESGSYSVSNN
jgi:prepilin-type N-terminal cleavage/methylation domain-containing protein